MASDSGTKAARYCENLRAVCQRDILVNASIISALAALAGAITGGLTSVLASWLAQTRTNKGTTAGAGQTGGKNSTKNLSQRLRNAISTHSSATRRTYPHWSNYMSGWAECAACPRQRWSKVLRLSRVCSATAAAPRKSPVRTRKV